MYEVFGHFLEGLVDGDFEHNLLVLGAHDLHQKVLYAVEPERATQFRVASIVGFFAGHVNQRLEVHLEIAQAVEQAGVEFSRLVRYVLALEAAPLVLERHAIDELHFEKFVGHDRQRQIDLLDQLRSLVFEDQIGNRLYFIEVGYYDLVVSDRVLLDRDRLFYVAAGLDVVCISDSGARAGPRAKISGKSM